MDGQQDNAIQPFDEAWFDVANPCGKEFELPNASSPIHPRWSDNSNNLVFLQDQQLHTPDILENSYELETIRSSCAGNQVDSCPIREMGTSIANFVPIVNPQAGVYIPPNKQLTHFCTSSNAFRLNSDDYIINDHVCLGFHFTILGLISSSGSSSSFGSSGCRPVRNQEIRSSSFTGSPSLQNGLSVQSNQVAYKFGGSANGDINHGPSHLQAVSHGTGITSNVPVPVENQVETSTRAPRSNCHGSEKNRTFGPSSSKNGRCDVKYTCKICKREFPNYNSLGGHMSFHAKMKKAKRKLDS
ncbi:hypothetical protein ACE6H2_015298 [Prunus campanulata]